MANIHLNQKVHFRVSGVEKKRCLVFGKLIFEIAETRDGRRNKTKTRCFLHLNIHLISLRLQSMFNQFRSNFRRYHLNSFDNPIFKRNHSFLLKNFLNQKNFTKKIDVFTRKETGMTIQSNAALLSIDSQSRASAAR